MDTFNDAKEAQNHFVERQKEFLELNYSFYLHLVEQINAKSQIPSGAFTKFKTGTNANTNIIEECVSIETNGLCRMEVGIQIENDLFRVMFLTNKKSSELLTLRVIICDTTKEFYKQVLGKDQIQKLNDEDVIDHIFGSISQLYYSKAKSLEMGR